MARPSVALATVNDAPSSRANRCPSDLESTESRFAQRTWAGIPALATSAASVSRSLVNAHIAASNSWRGCTIQFRANADAAFGVARRKRRPGCRSASSASPKSRDTASVSEKASSTTRCGNRDGKTELYPPAERVTDQAHAVEAEMVECRDERVEHPLVAPTSSQREEVGHDDPASAGEQLYERTVGSRTHRVAVEQDDRSTRTGVDRNLELHHSTTPEPTRS